MSDLEALQDANEENNRLRAEIERLRALLGEMVNSKPGRDRWQAIDKGRRALEHKP